MENQFEDYLVPPTQDEKTLAVLAHVLGFFGSFLVPLIIYLVKKDESPFVREHAKEALNFHISMAIYFTISVILILVIIGILGVIFLGTFSLVVSIVAAIKALDGKPYRYPLCIRFIK
ncbi:MAG: hypothetical protein RL377_421 [Bacteroidota bacterium]